MPRMFASWLTDPGFVFLVSLLARSVVILMCACAIGSVLSRRASAATRGTILSASMCALLLLPLVWKLAPGWRVAVMPARERGEIRGTESLPNPPPEQGAATEPETSGAAASAFTVPKASAAPTTTSVAPSDSSPYRVSIPICLWAAGTVGYGIWLVVGRLRLLTLSSRCPVVSAGPLVDTVAALAAQVGVNTRVIVRQAYPDPSGSVTPMTWGWLRPTLLLPRDVLETWPEERTRAVLLHELAHIARRDWLTQAVMQIVCALHWFNPLVWRVANWWEREAELACDDRVILTGVVASDYAAHLLEVVRSLRALHPVVAQGSAHAMAAPRSNVQTRLIAILAERRNRRQTSFATGLTVLVLSAALLVPIGALHPTARAMEFTAPRADAEALLEKATDLSWRGEWASAAKLADQALMQRNLSDPIRATAYWLLFEAAWWQGDSAVEDRYYGLFKEIATRNQANQYVQSSLMIADRYRSDPNPKTLSLDELITGMETLIKSKAYADGLHYAKYLLGRPNVPEAIRLRALLAAYRGAHYWKYADTVAALDRQFHAEIRQIPAAARPPMEAEFMQARQEKTRSDKGLDGPTNLDFALGTEGWGNDNPEHDSEQLYEIGVDARGRRADKPSAFLVSKGSDPSHYGALMQNFVQPNLKGKRIRYSAYLKTQGVTKGAGIWIVLFGAKNHNHAWNMTATPLMGTNDWKKVAWVFDVPDDNTGFSFGIELTGNGKVWVDDFHFDVVDKSTPVSPVTQ